MGTYIVSMEWKGGGGGLCRVRGRAHYDVAKGGGRRRGVVVLI